MTQQKKLKTIIKELRDSEIKMDDSDHMWCGMISICIFLYSLWHLIDGDILIFIVLNSSLGMGIISYYWIIKLQARKSWVWEEVRREVEGKDLREMWDTCERGDWLLWFSAHMIGKDNWPTHQQVVLASCQCARLTTNHIKLGRKHLLNVIETTEAWARGDATVDHLIDSVNTAGDEINAIDTTEDLINAVNVNEYLSAKDVNYCATEAVKSAAWAVYAREDGHSFRLAQAANDAATYAALASKYLEGVTTKKGEATEKVTLRECANIVRRMLTIPKKLNGELPLYNWVKRWDKNIEGKCTGFMKHIPIAVSHSTNNYKLKGDEIDNAKINPVLRTVTVALGLGAVAALIVALGKNPIQYYTMLRWLTCLVAVMLVWRGVLQGSLKWAYVLVPIAILFNPIIPIHLHGSRLEILWTWKTIDIVVAVVLALLIILMEMQVLLKKRL